MKQRRLSSILFKIVALIASVLISVMLFVDYFIYTNQKENLMTATDRGIYLNSGTLMTALKNMMLDGRAPLLVRSISELQSISGYKSIAIYRTNGIMAFSDYQTLDNVNERQKAIHFSKTPRMKDDRTDAEKNLELKDIRYSLDNNRQLENLKNDSKVVEYYFPIENQAECMKCHGSGYPYRGVIHLELSMAGTFRQIDRTRTLLTIFFMSVSAVLITILVIFLQRLVVSPVVKIGEAVQQVGEGDFKARINLKSHDELGNLAEQINIMIKGLGERFKLSKYVSSSTRSQITSGEDSTMETKKRIITVLFSDVRGFTSYTESHSAEEVVENLNKILEIQAETVESFHGDVDKFIGDEIMAVFEDEQTALFCAAEMIHKVSSLNLGLEVGVGINTGEVLEGNIGSKNRQEFAVIGDAVNVASRLCSLAKPKGILISESVYFQVYLIVEAEIQKDIKIRGKSKVIDVFEVKAIKARK